MDDAKKLSTELVLLFNSYYIVDLSMGFVHLMCSLAVLSYSGS